MLAARKGSQAAGTQRAVSSAPKVGCILLCTSYARPAGRSRPPSASVHRRNYFPRPSILCRYKVAPTARLLGITRLGLSLNRLYNIFMGESIHSKDYKLFIERLRKVRLEAGITQVQAALKLKKPQSYVSKIERGERRIDVVELQHMLRIYKKGIKDFF